MGPVHYRFVAIYLVMLNVLITLYFRHRRRDSKSVTVGGYSVRTTITGVWTTIIVVFAFASDPLELWDFEVWAPLRWSALLPGMAAIGLTVWALRSRLGRDESGNFVAEGPFRWCSYPVESAWVVIFLSVAALGCNLWYIAVSLVALLAMRVLVPRQQDILRQAVFGKAYCEYQDRAGCFVPATANVDQPRYNVPNRFGLTAILGLLTTLAIIFGVLKHYNSPPIVYLFVVSEIVTICLVQIVIGSAPRGASALTGAVLLPFWVFMTLRASYLGMTIQVLLLLFMVAFGALLGYCIGALAAGFFMLMDMFEPWLTGEARPYAAHSADAPQKTNVEP